MSIEIETVDNPTPNPEPDTKRKTYEQLEADYESVIKDQVKARAKINEYKSTISALEPQARKVTELEEKVTQTSTAYQVKLAQAEFKGRLRAEGITDPDILKLIDLSTAKVGDDGEVANADEIWDKFKASKAYLFQGKEPVNTSSGSTRDKPKPDSGTQIDWLKATAEEVAKARKPSRL